jgi:hypothetical protein
MGISAYLGTLAGLVNSDRNGAPAAPVEVSRLSLSYCPMSAVTEWSFAGDGSLRRLNATFASLSFKTIRLCSSSTKQSRAFLSTISTFTNTGDAHHFHTG